jgi:hypothetical protein
MVTSHSDWHCQCWARAPLRQRHGHGPRHWHSHVARPGPTQLHSGWLHCILSNWQPPTGTVASHGCQWHSLPRSYRDALSCDSVSDCARRARPESWRPHSVSDSD